MTEKNTYQIASQAERKNPEGCHIVKIFPTLIALLDYQTDYCLLLFRRTFFYRTNEEGKINLQSM